MSGIPMRKAGWRGVSRRGWRAAPAAAALALVAASAWAHAALIRSHPAPNASLSRAPAKVQVWFNEELATQGSKLSVWGEKGEQADKGDSRVSLDNRALMEVALKPLPPGRYTVKWRAMADDDREVTLGDFTFRVTAPR